MRYVWYLIGLLALLALILGLWVLRNLASAGQFSTLRPMKGDCRTVTGMTGVEDIQIDHASGHVFFSAHDRRAFFDKRPDRGGLFLGKLDALNEAPVDLTAGMSPSLRPHGISLYTHSDGSQVLGVVNHPQKDKSEILLFDVVKKDAGGIALSFRRLIRDASLPSVNDLHLTGPEQFYATIDRGSETELGWQLEQFLQLPRSRLVYFDGKSASVAASDLKYANGVNGARDGTQIYVAEATGLGVRFYDRDPTTGALTLKNNVFVGAAVDNLDVDVQGRVWAVAHPHPLDFLYHARDPKHLSPTQVLLFEPKPGGDGGTVRQVYLDLGGELSGGSVAAVHGGRMLVGSVFEAKYLDCAAPK